MPTSTSSFPVSAMCTVHYLDAPAGLGQRNLAIPLRRHRGFFWLKPPLCPERPGPRIRPTRFWSSWTVAWSRCGKPGSGDFAACVARVRQQRPRRRLHARYRHEGASPGWSEYDGQADIVTPIGVSGTADQRRAPGHAGHGPRHPCRGLGRCWVHPRFVRSDGWAFVVTKHGSRHAISPHPTAMPHLVILYTPNLTCLPIRAVPRGDQAVPRPADTMLAQRRRGGQARGCSRGGVALAYPVAQFAVSDGGAAGQAAGWPVARRAATPLCT